MQFILPGRNRSLKFSMIVLALLALTSACINSKPPAPNVVAIEYLEKLIKQKGELGTLALADCPEGLRKISRTRIPSIPASDWNPNTDFLIETSISMGPGALPAGPDAFHCTAKNCDGIIPLSTNLCPECARKLHEAPRYAIPSVNYGAITYSNLISIDFPFELTTSDGTVHSGCFALRPVNGELKVIPPPLDGSE